MAEHDPVSGETVKMAAYLAECLSMTEPDDIGDLALYLHKATDNLFKKTRRGVSEQTVEGIFEKTALECLKSTLCDFRYGINKKDCTGTNAMNILDQKLFERSIEAKAFKDKTVAMLKILYRHRYQ